MSDASCPHCRSSVDFELDQELTYRPIVSSFTMQRFPNNVKRRAKYHCLQCGGVVLIDLESKTIEVVETKVDTAMVETLMPTLSDPQTADEPIDSELATILREAGIIGLNWLSTHRQARSAVIEQTP